MRKKSKQAKKPEAIKPKLFHDRAWMEESPAEKLVRLKMDVAVGLIGISLPRQDLIILLTLRYVQTVVKTLLSTPDSEIEKILASARESALSAQTTPINQPNGNGSALDSKENVIEMTPAPVEQPVAGLGPTFEEKSPQ